MENMTEKELNRLSDLLCLGIVMKKLPDKLEPEFNKLYESASEEERQKAAAMAYNILNKIINTPNEVLEPLVQNIVTEYKRKQRESN